MIKQFLLLIIASITLGSSLFAQRSEIGLTAGAAYYMGDINPSKPFSQSRPMAGVLFRYNFTTRWAMKFTGTYGRLLSDDARYQNERNLSFRNDITEFSAQTELNFLPFFIGSARTYRWTPYLFAGVALLFHNPQGYYFDEFSQQGHWVALQPLCTEGQTLTAYPDRKAYSLAQFTIPFGIGFKFSLSQRLSLGLEWGMRLTFTDYLDDVSTTYVNPVLLSSEIGPKAAYMSDRSERPNVVGSERGNAQTNDWYGFAGVVVTYKLNKGDSERCSAYGPKSRIAKPIDF